MKNICRRQEMSHGELLDEKMPHGDARCDRLLLYCCGRKAVRIEKYNSCEQNANIKIHLTVKMYVYTQ